jgi:hypothetical protein
MSSFSFLTYKYKTINLSDVFLGTQNWFFKRYLDGKNYSIDNPVFFDSYWNSLEDMDFAYEKLIEDEQIAAKTQKFAWSPKLGYLAPTLSSCGTGLKVNVSFHLLGSYLMGELDAIKESLKAMRFNILKIDCDDAGQFYAIENDSSFGIDAHSLYQRIREVIINIATAEACSRYTLLKSKTSPLSDYTHRNLAIARNCRLMSRQELMDIFSAFRLASQLKLIKLPNPNSLERVIQTALGCECAFMEEFGLNIAKSQSDAELFKNPVFLATVLRDYSKSIKFTALGKKVLQ